MRFIDYKADGSRKICYDPAIHHRRSIRLRGHDYAGRGMYFVTVCVEDRRPLFGTVVNRRMALNDAGRAAAACWRAIPDHFPHTALDEWIVMPDHVHGILLIDGTTECRTREAPAFGRPISGALGTIIGAFKAATTRTIRSTGLACQTPPMACQTPPMACQPPPMACQTPPAIWQRNYHEIIIRDDRALHNIRRYICENPAHWDTLRYGKPRFFAGNLALLDLPLTAFLASRVGDGRAECRGERFFALASWPERPACVISGFLSPMERAVFDACLANSTPMIWILAHGLPDRFPPRIKRALYASRLLVMTPFDGAVAGFSAARAAWCNQYALHLAANAVIGQLAPDGMLACLLADLRREIPIRHPEDQPIAKES